MISLLGRRGSIRRKLFVGALLASVAGLTIAGVGLFAYDLHTYRASSATSIMIEAELMGQASAAALQFDDRTVANANLALLRARPGMRVAALYNPRGAVFASYLRSDVDRAEIPRLPEADSVRIVDDSARAFRRIMVGSEIAGTIYLVEDLETGTRIVSYALITLTVLVAALAVSALLSAWVQKGITGPIIRVSDLAQRVVNHRDYSVRAERTTDDEIGMLVDGFNDMLSQIQSRTSALEATSAEVRALNLDLERRVGERTAQLEESNLQLKAANQAKSSFLSMMSHEIRTPMNGVLGMLELLSLTQLDGSQRTTLGIVRDSGRSLLRIIDDILDFSKIEAGKLEVRPEAASIERVVKSVAGIYSGTASSKGLIVKSSCDARISPALMFDPMRLQQILNNLMSNAVKFTHEGWVEINAELHEHHPHTDIVRICVMDTGIGISEAGQALLFEPFSQASGQVARTFGGTGLGLSIGRRLAELMGGTISISSKLGVGTTATVTLPLEIADPASLPPEKALHARHAPDVLVSRRKAPTVSQARAEGTLVLVADDHPVNRLLVARQVTILGYAHVDAEDGHKALELWRSGGIGLVITDCNMPVIDGYELARRIRAREAEEGLAPVPIIACTANALAGEAERCFAAGMNDYVAKPVDLPRLAAKLDRWLPVACAAPADPATIERSVLAEVTGGDARVERNILQQFARSHLEDLETLAQALDAHSALQVARVAHRMKGASLAIGALAVGRAAESLESAARAGNWDAIAVERRRIVDESERLGKHLE